jgi:hypothetical protein
MIIVLELEDKYLSREEETMTTKSPNKVVHTVNTIPIMELLKHFPYHNESYDIWLDEEYGKEEGYELIDNTIGDKFRAEFMGILKNIPYTLNQVVSIEGKGFRRDIGITIPENVLLVQKIISNSKVTDSLQELHYDISMLAKKREELSSIKVI